MCTKAHFNFQAPKGKRHLQNRQREMPSIWEEGEVFPSSTKWQRPPQKLQKEKNSLWWEK